MTTPLYGQYDSEDGAHISTLRQVPLSSSRAFIFSGFSDRGGSDLILKFKAYFLRIPFWLMVLGLLQALPVLAQSTAVGAAAGKFVVVVDAAHGGDDGGGQIGNSVAEKTVTLALSVRLRSLLAARGLTVVTTREGNINLDGDARAQIANRTGAAACLSLHASESGAGVHLFVSSLAPTGPTRFLPWKTAQSAYVNRSLKLAGALNSAFLRSGDSSNAGAGQIPATLARASLSGVDSMACPAVAVEIAPIRGSDGAIVTDVTDAQYQAQIVEALAAALLEWKTDWETDRVHAGGRQP